MGQWLRRDCVVEARPLTDCGPDRRDGQEVHRLVVMLRSPNCVEAQRATPAVACLVRLEPSLRRAREVPGLDPMGSVEPRSWVARVRRAPARPRSTTAQ